MSEVRDRAEIEVTSKMLAAARHLLWDENVPVCESRDEVLAKIYRSMEMERLKETHECARVGTR